jgi:hypothetical protein
LLRFAALCHLLVKFIRDATAKIILIQFLNNAVEIIDTLTSFNDFGLYCLELLLILIALLVTSFLIEYSWRTICSSAIALIWCAEHLSFPLSVSMRMIAFTAAVGLLE